MVADNLYYHNYKVIKITPCFVYCHLKISLYECELGQDVKVADFLYPSVPYLALISSEDSRYSPDCTGQKQMPKSTIKYSSFDFVCFIVT